MPHTPRPKELLYPDDQAHLSSTKGEPKVPRAKLHGELEAAGWAVGHVNRGHGAGAQRARTGMSLEVNAPSAGRSLGSRPLAARGR